MFYNIFTNLKALYITGFNNIIADSYSYNQSVKENINFLFTIPVMSMENFVLISVSPALFGIMATVFITLFVRALKARFLSTSILLRGYNIALDRVKSPTFRYQVRFYCTT